MTHVAFVAAVAVLGFAGAAQADEEVVREADKTVYKAKTEVVFNGIDVEGATVKPDAPLVVAKPKSDFANMIQHRKNFHSELKKDAQ